MPSEVPNSFSTAEEIVDAFVRILVDICKTAKDTNSSSKYKITHHSDCLSVPYRDVMEDHEYLSQAFDSLNVRKLKIWRDAKQKYGLEFLGTNSNQDCQFPKDIDERYKPLSRPSKRKFASGDQPTRRWTSEHYNEMGLADVESGLREKIKLIWESNEGNHLRGPCFKMFYEKISHLAQSSRLENYYAMCNSIKTYVEDLTHCGRHSNSIPQIPKMRSIYQLRTIKTDEDTRKFYYRYACCWCRYCILGEYDSCTVLANGVPSDWKQFDLTLQLFCDTERQSRCCSHCLATGHDIRTCC